MSEATPFIGPERAEFDQRIAEAAARIRKENALSLSIYRTLNPDVSAGSFYDVWTWNLQEPQEARDDLSVIESVARAAVKEPDATPEEWQKSAFEHLASLRFSQTFDWDSLPSGHDVDVEEQLVGNLQVFTADFLDSELTERHTEVAQAAADIAAHNLTEQGVRNV